MVPLSAANRRLRVLLLDGDPTALAAARSSMSSALGVQLEATSEPARANGLLRAADFDAWILREGVGLDPAAAVERARAAGIRTPAIVLVASSSEALEERLVEAGATDLLLDAEATPDVLERALRYAVAQAEALAMRRASEARYALALAGADAAIWEWEPARDRVFVSERALQLLGATDSAPERAEDLVQLTHPDDRDRLRRAFEAVRAGADTIDEEVRPHAGAAILHARGARTAAAGRPMVSGSLTDVSRQRAVLAALRSSEADLRAVFESAPHAFMLVDLQRRVQVCSAAAARALVDALGGPPEVGASLDALFPTAADGLAVGVARAAAGATLHLELELPCSGGDRWFDVSFTPIRDATDTVSGVCLAALDIHDTKGEERALLHTSRHDPLTGLPNRAHLVEHLSAVPGSDVAVLHVDIDRFKVVNDSMGHTFGDALLVALALRLRILTDGYVARLGADEFLVVARGTPLDAAFAAERLRIGMRAPLVVGGTEVVVTASVGVATRRAESPSTLDLLRDANMAMSRAKGLGGDRVVAFDAAMHRAAIARMHLESDLSVAIDRQELFLRYQPIVDLRTGCVARLEALVRWRRGDTIVPPGDFVPISEGTGFIVPMSRWVLAEAAARTREWLALAPDLRIAVNVSGRHFMLPSFADDVFGALEAAGLPARNLELEITESVAMADAARAVRVIERLRDGGVSTSIDDFGTGYSSLAYLHRFPVDALKIDRSFVSDTEPGADAWPIVRSILALATQRGMSVVAEGVESAEQLARLRALGCPYAQGFLLSRPLAAADVPPMFAGPLV